MKTGTSQPLRLEYATRDMVYSVEESDHIDLLEMEGIVQRYVR